MTRKPSATAATIQVYQCPAHRDFMTLVLEMCGNPGGGSRYATSKCCVRQYDRLLRQWRLSIDEARAFAEELECGIEAASKEADDDRED